MGAHIVKDCIDRLETREEADFVYTCIFIGYAGIFVLGTDNGVVCWVELKFCTDP